MFFRCICEVYQWSKEERVQVIGVNGELLSVGKNCYERMSRCVCEGVFQEWATPLGSGFWP